jgi:DNA polymerase-3 subunit gamma/tau
VTPYEFHRNRVNTDEVRQVIEEVILHQFGEKISILCVTRAEMSSMAPTTAPSQPAASQTAPPPAPRASAPTRESASRGSNVVEDPAPVETTDPPMIVEAERQIEAARNIFDAEIEDPGKP